MSAGGIPGEGPFRRIRRETPRPWIGAVRWNGTREAVPVSASKRRQPTGHMPWISSRSGIDRAKRRSQGAQEARTT